MSAVVLFESEFGATRIVADAIAVGFRQVSSAALENVREVSHPLDTSVDLLIVGAPTHARSLPSATSRAAAQTWPAKPGSVLTLEPRSAEPGVREWLVAQDLRGVSAVAFATRMDVARAFSGSSVRAIERGLRSAGATIGAPSQTFVVDRSGLLLPGEIERAVAWGRSLASTSARALAGGVA